MSGRGVIVRRKEYLHWRAQQAAQRMGQGLYRVADRVAGAAFRREARQLPAPIQLDGRTIDTLDDLAAFTGLDGEIVRREVRSRRQINFRNEWLATPEALRSDHWFYLSSKTYLFANAAHFTDDGFIRNFVLAHLPPGSRVLDYGGGTGELALRLAAAGVSTTVVELSALQRDFIRFRVDRHAVGDVIDVLDFWSPVPAGAFDGVIAMDVLEHLPDAREALEHRLLPALRPGGALIEDSPFKADPANPMHHEDFGLERFMRDRGFSVVGAHGRHVRAWRRQPGASEK